jgi:hypothetical protein
MKRSRPCPKPATSTRAVFLPAIDQRVSLKQYVAGVKVAKANPNTTFKHGLTTWWPTTGREILQQFRSGMNDRINQGVPYSIRGLMS